MPFTGACPKPLIPVLGVPSIDYSISILKMFGVQNVVVNVHAHAEKMKSHLAALSGVQVKISDESKLLLGSAGGFRKALPHFHGSPFFGMNADVITRINLSTLEKRHAELKAKHGVVMTLAILQGSRLQTLTEKYRELHLDPASGLIKGFGEKKQSVPFYSGVGVFETEAFQALSDGIPHEFVPEVLEPWIQKNKVGFFLYDDLWIDLGSPELWWKAHQEMLEHSHEQPWAELIEAGLKSGKICLDEPWKGWVKYGKDATPQNFLGKKGIQLDNLCYECKF